MLNETFEQEITPKLLLEELDCNREIEFMLCERLYFAEPIADQHQPQKYGIWDVEQHRCIFEGDIPSMFSFCFPGGQSFENDFEVFDFLYIY